MAEPHARSPFGAHLGMRVVELDEDRATVSLTAGEGLANTGGVLHGGAICSLADMAAGAAVLRGFGGPGRGATASLSIDFIESVHEGEVTAEATVLRRGGSLCFCDVRVTDAGGRLVAKAQVVYRLA